MVRRLRPPPIENDMTRASFAQTAAQIEVDAQALEAVLDKVCITVLKTAARIYRFVQANVDPADIPVKGVGRADTPATHTAADRARAYRARGGDELRARNAERMRRKRAQERLAKQARDNVLVLH
jgi:hypothetical protein